MGSLFPNIIKKINKKIKELKLKSVEERPENLVADKKRFYRTIAKTPKEKKVFFKTLLIRERGVKNRFLNEINFYKFLKEHPEHPLFNFTPQLLDFSLNPSFPYLLYKFLPGKSKTKNDKFKKEELQKISKLLIAINHSPYEDLSLIPKIKSLNFSYYKKRCSFLLKNIQMPSSIKKAILEVIAKNKIFLNNHNISLSHGDFSESNLIFEQGKIKLIDWEHVYLKNFLYDFASFWVKRIDKPQEQKILFNFFLRECKEKENCFFPLFKISLVEICLKNLLLCQKIIKELEKKKNTKGIKKVTKEKNKYLKIIKNYIIINKEKIYSCKNL